MIPWSFGDGVWDSGLIGYTIRVTETGLFNVNDKIILSTLAEAKEHCENQFAA